MGKERLCISTSRRMFWGLCGFFSCAELDASLDMTKRDVLVADFPAKRYLIIFYKMYILTHSISYE